MRVIITGGTGLIGRALTANLVDRYEVVILSRDPQAQRADLPPGARLVGWDAKSAAGWGHLADGAFAIINLAGAGIADGRWTAARKALIVNSRVQAGQAVVEAVHAAAVKPQVVVQASAVGYYGPRSDEFLNEASAPGSDWTAGVVKAWEPATAEVEALDVRRVVARIGVVLSKEGGALPKLLLPFKFFAGGPLGSGEQWISWIHLDDVVRAIRFLMENPQASGPYNLSAPTPVTNRVMVNKIGLVLERPALVPAPALALKLALGEMSSVVLDGQRVLPQRLTAEGFAFRFSDVETALRDLL